MTAAGQGARAMALALLAKRAPGATICPSEVARGLAAAAGDPSGWRARMDEVHAAVDGLVGAGAVALSWKGNALARREGPYRIARGVAD